MVKNQSNISTVYCLLINISTLLGDSESFDMKFHDLIDTDLENLRTAFQKSSMNVINQYSRLNEKQVNFFLYF